MDRTTINLDAIRAQRLEAEGGRDFDLTFAGRTYRVPFTSWLPITQLQELGEASSFADQISAILGAKATKQLLADGITGAEVQAILAAMEGPSLGESSDSAES